MSEYIYDLEFWLLKLPICLLLWGLALCILAIPLSAFAETYIKLKQAKAEGAEQ